MHGAGSRQSAVEGPLAQQELVLVMPAVLPKLHQLTQAMLQCRGSHVFKVTAKHPNTAMCLHAAIHTLRVTATVDTALLLHWHAEMYKNACARIRVDMKSMFPGCMF